MLKTLLFMSCLSCFSIRKLKFLELFGGWKVMIKVQIKKKNYSSKNLFVLISNFDIHVKSWISVPVSKIK